MINGVKSFYICILLDLKSLQIDALILRANDKHLNMKSRSNSRKRAQSEGGSASVGSEDFLLASHHGVRSQGLNIHTACSTLSNHEMVLTLTRWAF